MKICHIGEEFYPVAKAGGLSNVIGSLLKYQNSVENQMNVIIPCYQTNFLLEINFE